MALYVIMQMWFMNLIKSQPLVVIQQLPLYKQLTAWVTQKLLGTQRI